MADEQKKVKQEILNWIEESYVFERMRCVAPQAEQCPRAIATLIVMITGEQTIAIAGYCPDHLGMVAASFEIGSLATKGEPA